MKKFNELINYIFGIKNKKEIKKGKNNGIIVYNKIFIEFIKEIDDGGKYYEKKIN